MYKFLTAGLLAGILHAQVPGVTEPAPATAAPAAPVKDPLGRTTPQESIFQFLEACHAHDYGKALRYLDLRKMSAPERIRDGTALAKQLEDLLDDTAFEITSLSRDPEGAQEDSLPPNLDRLETLQVDGQMIELQLERIALKAGYRVWVVSAESVALIPLAHQVIAETPFEKKLPQKLVTVEFFETPIWRWIALLGMAIGLWFVAGLLARAVVAAVRPVFDAHAFRGPVRLAAAVAAFRVAMESAPPATLSRALLERGLGMTFSLSLAWAAAVAVDLITDRWRLRLDPRMQAVSYSILPLGQQVVKLSLFVFTALAVLNVWGYNTTTILAGLGVGGLAVALAAQKTIENLFGGISVIGDRPVLVGDVCRFGSRVGTVTHIGLRSTRIQTPDRTIISVPNAQFSSMELENISSRDKIWFHPTLNLRRDTTSTQLLEVLSSFTKILADEPQVEVGKLPVRFVGVGPFSMDVEVAAYVMTADNDEFLKLQQTLLLKMLQAIERAGTSLAVPLQETFEAQRAPQA